MIFGTVLLLSFIFTLPDGKLHIVFCNVGQGDAVYIRTPSNQDMLIDGGPDDKVLSCLGKNMPFYDRTIDVVLLTHPQKDHLQGLISVVQRYNVKYFVIGVAGNQTQGYQRLAQEIKNKKIPIKNLYTGDKFYLGKVEFDVLWPERKWVAIHTSALVAGDASAGSPMRAAARQSKGEHALGLASGRTRELESGAVLGLSTDTELNSFSYFLHMKYDSFDTLFTGDGDSKIQPQIMKTGELPEIEVLKFPHHGSKTAILPEFLDKIKPSLTIISVGKNSYGHPTKEAIELLNQNAIKIKRTDLDGEVEVVSDGKTWVSD